MKATNKLNIYLGVTISLVIIGFISIITLAALNAMGTIPDAITQPIITSTECILSVVIFSAMVVPFVLIDK